MSQYDRPAWTPLLDVVGDQVTGDFMWMFEVALVHGPAPDRYRSVPTADVLAAVFAPLPCLVDVTDGG